MAMLTGVGPPDPKTITFLPSRHHKKVYRFNNRRGIIGLVGFVELLWPIRAPLGRFRVGLMKTSKTQNFKNFSSPSFGTKRKVAGKGRLLPEISFLESESDFKSGLSRVEVADFFSGDREVKTS